MNKTFATFAFAVVTLAMGSGCSAMTTSTPVATGPAKWDTVKLADGVELRVSDEAGIDARRVAEQIQSEMRSRYISAR